MAMSEKQVARWERTIKRGKTVFIIKNALIFFVVLTVLNAVVEYLFEKRLPDFSWFGVVFQLGTGVIIAFAIWLAGRGRYKNYLLDKKIAKGPHNAE
jgi:hypothetical protein